MLSEQQIAALPSGTHVAEHHYGNTWSATVYFGDGDEARDAMRLFADAVRTGQLVAVQADDATVERVAKAVHDAMVDDEESDAWMSGKCPLDSVTIDGDVNLIKAAKAAISALAAKGGAMTEAAKLRPFEPADYIKTPEDLEAYRDAVREAALDEAARLMDLKDAGWRALETKYRAAGNKGPYLGGPSYSDAAQAIRALKSTKQPIL